MLDEVRKFGSWLSSVAHVVLPVGLAVSVIGGMVYHQVCARRSECRRAGEHLVRFKHEHLEAVCDEAISCTHDPRCVVFVHGTKLIYSCQYNGCWIEE